MKKVYFPSTITCIHTFSCYYHSVLYSIYISHLLTHIYMYHVCIRFILYQHCCRWQAQAIVSKCCQAPYMINIISRLNKIKCFSEHRHSAYFIKYVRCVGTTGHLIVGYAMHTIRISPVCFLVQQCNRTQCSSIIFPFCSDQTTH